MQKTAIQSFISRFYPVLRFIDRLSEWTGRVSAWLVLLLVLLIGCDVTMRYLANTSFVAVQELEWHLFALIFLLGAAYTLKHDDHVRVDVWYQARRAGPRYRAWVNLLGSLLFLLPLCVLIISSSWPFVANAYASLEGSPDPGGLPYRWLLKAAIPLGFFLLLLQGVAESLRSGLFLLGVAPQEKS